MTSSLESTRATHSTHTHTHTAHTHAQHMHTRTYTHTHRHNKDKQTSLSLWRLHQPLLLRLEPHCLLNPDALPASTRGSNRGGGGKKERERDCTCACACVRLTMYLFVDKERAGSTHRHRHRHRLALNDCGSLPLFNALLPLLLRFDLKPSLILPQRQRLRK